MVVKTVPFSKAQAEAIAAECPTPFHIYDEKAIRENARRLKKAFSWNEGFKNYFAIKACPNPHLMRILREEGMGIDASSLCELVLAERVGMRGEEIMFSANDTPVEEYRKAAELGAIINLDDITHIPCLDAAGGLPEVACFRYNPGPLRGGNAIIGKPEEAKYGLTHDQMVEAFRIMKSKGVKRFGMHTMVASNELNPQYFIDTAGMMFDLAAEVSRKVGITFEFINLGGGIGIPYRLEQEAVDLGVVSQGIRQQYEEKVTGAGFPPLKILMENGRMVTGPFGYLVSRVLHLKHIYREYVGLDACMANLMRPALYGAYHHITVLGKEKLPRDRVYDVTGSLCENNDKFAIQRPLPEMVPGDLVAIHEAGAHGHAMGFNYNGKLRSAELLLRPDGSVRQIRRAETVEDYFKTVDFTPL